MASSRQMRGRRLPSPTKHGAPQTRPAIKNEMQTEPINGGALSEDWEEPAPRTPAPSFEDYKGLERHGVLEHMAPLGHLPGQKLRAKMKYQETGPRGRITQVKNGDTRVVNEEVNTPEPAPMAPSPRRSEPTRQEILPKPPRPREADGEGDYEAQHSASAAAAGPMTSLPTQPAVNGTSASRPSAEGRDKMKEVVIKAAKRANDTGNPLLGHAIQQLYEESFHSQKVADLLAAVLAQKQTPEQTTEFQLYIKAAKKAIKHGKGDMAKPRSLSNSVSQSPNKIGRTSVTRPSRTLNDTGATDLHHLPSPTTHNSSGRPQINHGMFSNGSPSKDERPAKRLKRNVSDENSSDLSSVDSQIEDLAQDVAIDNHLPPQRAFQTGPKPSLGPRLGSFTRKKHSSARKQSVADVGQHPAELAADDEYAAKRRNFLEQQKFGDYHPTESNVRPARRELRATQTITPVHTPPHRTQVPQSRLRTGTLQRNKRYDDDDDDLSSPPSSPGDLLIPPPTGASRGETPNQFRRHLKPVKRAKIKNSPLKKHRNVTAGVARPLDTENATLGTRRADDSHDHENSDNCAACSGGGKLLCCDGCERAFHFSCLEPPLDSDIEPEGEWLCTKCLKNRLEFPTQSRGIFRELSADVNVKNPSAFNLPTAVRDYFDGVKTGEEGEYEETISVNAKKAHGGGYEENPNNLKLRDSKDNAILCFRCGRSAMGKGGLATREIVACDFCSCSWHLDCLDPPLASAPNRKSTNGKPRHTWMCPAHVDEEQLYLDPARKATNTAAKLIHPPTSRSYRVRRPKHPKIIDIGLRRGFRNNGFIEIENESSGEEDEIYKELSSGRVRAPESGFKLDFIDRIDRINRGYAQVVKPKQEVHYQENATQTDPSSSTSTPAKSILRAELNRLSFVERKVALNLAQFAHSQNLAEEALDPDQITNLIETLTAEAPESVERLVTDAEKAAASGKKDDSTSSSGTIAPLSEEETKDLEALIALAQHRLQHRGSKG